MRYSHQKVTFNSKILNLETYYNIYIPQSNKNSPILIYLHGWGDTPENNNLIHAVESLTHICPITPIVLFPWGFEAKECSEWIDRYDGTLSLETHIIHELIPEVEEKHLADKCKKSKMICGHSMGGFGAINIALHNQDLFCSCAAWSPKRIHRL